MTATVQTAIAFVFVALAAALLLRIWFGKKKTGGCDHGSCGAVSPEIKDLQARLKR